MDTNIRKLKEIIDTTDNIVFFGGAGVSTESGIPDFRSVDGLYHQKYDYPPETILSHTFYRRKPAEFFRFYRDKMLCLDAEPNAAHLKLAEWERMGKLKAVVTQNIDGLHQKAGSKVVYELHGSTLRNYCERCHKFYDAQYILDSGKAASKEPTDSDAQKNAAHQDGIPRCECGGPIKPDVVLYEEGLDQTTINGAVQAIRNADVLIIGGTSLVVYPAAGLIDYYRGHKLILINKTTTPRDADADLVIQGSIGEIFSQL